MALKLPSLNGRISSDKINNRDGLPLFDWIHFKDKQDAIGRGSLGLVWHGNMKLVTFRALQVRDSLPLNMVWYRPRVSGSHPHPKIHRVLHRDCYYYKRRKFTIVCLRSTPNFEFCHFTLWSCKERQRNVPRITHAQSRCFVN